MAAITMADVRHVAMLARLDLTDERAQALTHELNTILEHMDVLSRVETDGVAEVLPTAALPPPSGLPERGDHGPPIPLGEPPESYAPEMRDGFFVVPRLATHEGLE